MTSLAEFLIGRLYRDGLSWATCGARRGQRIPSTTRLDDLETLVGFGAGSSR